MDKKDIRSLSLDELKIEMESIGEKAFRAKQVYEWLHTKLADSFEEMTNLSKDLREKLDGAYRIPSVKMLERQVSNQDGTNKFLFQLEDGNVVESVLMRYKHGNSVCISSQVGCRMGCKFCASTIGGLERNLLPSEMLGQIYQIQKISGERVSNIVIMGTGEPLDNYDNFVRFIRLVSDENGLNISQRNITVSTCGIVPNIKRLAEEGFQITLALSLHGSTQEKRKTLMPIANKYELSEVLDACDYYFEKTGRRISFEYSLVQGVNDRDEDARELIGILKPRNCHLNLIPVNPIKERDFQKPSRKSAEEFKNRIADNTFLETVNKVKVKKGDLFFIEAGTLHAIGKGILLAEIQQNSNTTYRVYDYGRLGADGKPRDLHVQKAIDVTNCTPPTRSTNPEGDLVEYDDYSTQLLTKCDLFNVKKVSVKNIFDGVADEKSFVSVLVTDGTGKIENIDIKKGDSLFIPANYGTFTISGNLEVIITRV